MDKFKIIGGKRLHGEVHISGAKNAALPIMASTLLTEGEHIIENAPDLIDITTICSLLIHLGGEIKKTSNSTLLVNTRNVTQFEAPYELVKTMRASILVLGPLLARLGKARVSLPGGCAIGARPVNLHIKALEALGAKIVLKEGYIHATAKKLKGSRIYFDIPTVTGTENTMMAAVLAEGTTVMENASREPEIVNLAETLSSMGAQIHGAGTDVIEIDGVKSLHPARAKIIPDRIETGTYMVAAAITGGEVSIKGCSPEHLTAITEKLRESGVSIQEADGMLTAKGPSRVRPVDLKTLPYPGFPTDMQAQFMALMTLSAGMSVIQESVFENRFMHVAELRRMGANIQINGSTAIIEGVKRLSGAQLMATDLRASASLILAGLAARGETMISRIYHIDRGYESIVEKLSMLGASITRLKE